MNGNDDARYNLTQTHDGEFLDQDGVTWASRENWLFLSVLGGCGCGASHEFGMRATALLQRFGEANGMVIAVQDDIDELLAHWVDAQGLLEHGTSVCYSWLTAKGRGVYDQLQAVEAA